MTLLEHIGELKDRLIVCAVAVLITTAIAFVFSFDLIRFLLVPSGQTQLTTLNPTENFATVFRVCLYAGVALAMPVILYQIYAYVAPALLPKEKRFVLTIGPFVLLLFVAGMAFCYYLLLPQALGFLLAFGGGVFDNQLRATEYLQFVTTFILAMGIVFETPAIIFALVKVRVLQRSWLVKQRRYVFLLSFLVAAVITPTPDPFNQLLVAIPMYLLWEFGLLLSRAA